MVSVPIKGCPKRIHFITVTKQVPHPRYGDRVPYFIATEKDDPNCPCRQNIRRGLTDA